MKYFLCLFFAAFTFLLAGAQLKVLFKLGKRPVLHMTDSIFIAGNFNQWNPRSSEFSLAQANWDMPELKIQLAPGVYEFKCTRGSWRKVESLKSGADIENRVLKIDSDTVIVIDILGWKDDIVKIPAKQTASKQVHIMDTAFFIPQLNRSRKIWIYLPVGYARSQKRYPVLYMHDGQNLFNEATSAFGEWGVDETLDSLVKSGKPACIVVGIENGGVLRMNEYNPYEFTMGDSSYASQKFSPEGDAYVDFLVQTLKPFVDNKYRTLTDNKNTIIAGSSMGGLISYYAMLQYPDIFGKGGIFSPAFWTAPEIKLLTDSLAGKLNGKLFFYMGEQEGDKYLNDMEDVLSLLGEKSAAMIYSVIDPGSRHNEKAWRKWFGEFYIWTIANGFNTVIKVNK